MKLLDKWTLSEWAYNQCKRGNDTPEIRKLITSQYWSFEYCRDIKDIKEMWSKIKSSYWAYWYCRWIKNRPEVKKFIELNEKEGIIMKPPKGNFKNEVIR